MTGRRPTMRPLFFAFVLLVTLPALTVAQDVPQSPWGAPDLQGNWDFRTITPLQRPEDLGDQAFLTEEKQLSASKAPSTGPSACGTEIPSERRPVGTWAATTISGWTRARTSLALGARR